MGQGPWCTNDHTSVEGHASPQILTLKAGKLTPIHKKEQGPKRRAITTTTPKAGGLLLQGTRKKDQGTFIFIHTAYKLIHGNVMP